MAHIKTFFISLSMSIMLLLGVLGLLAFGTVSYDRITGGNRQMYYEQIAVMTSDARDDFLKERVTEYVKAADYDGLRVFAEDYKFDYYVSRASGGPVAKNCYLTVEKMVDQGAISVFIMGEEKNYSATILPRDLGVGKLDPIVAQVFFVLYSRVGVLVAGILFSLLISILGTYFLLVTATPFYKLWFCLLVLTLAEVLGLRYYLGDVSRVLIRICLMEKLMVGLVFSLYIMQGYRLRRGIQRVNEDRQETPLAVSTFPISMQPFAEDINTAAGHITVAVNERIRSERLKTELISNVSHDIKTPLTSIINFSDLIYQEETENETVKEYADHLHRQSVRMKGMMEALIEASKASVGAVEIQLVPCKVATLLDQCVIEYETKLQKKDIALVTEIPEEELMIQADVKSMSRIIDNLMSNICKYALPHSRASILAEPREDKICISFKNISEEPLNISGDELTERFVRGDASRHSEGHGLGLSIVKSLMDLMGADLSISSRFDVFEAKLIFQNHSAGENAEKIDH